MSSFSLLTVIMKTNKGKEDETPRDAFFFAAKAQKEIDALWDNGTINEDTINQWGAEHMRTPYRYMEASTSTASNK